MPRYHALGFANARDIIKTVKDPEDRARVLRQYGYMCRRCPRLKMPDAICPCMTIEVKDHEP